MRKLLFLFICAIAATSFSSELFAITGGTRVAASDPLARQIVLLRLTRNNRVKTCSGFYFSERLIVTAAHCLNYVTETAPKRPNGPISKAMRTTNVKVFHRHAGVWRQSEEIRFDKENDIAIVIMPLPHPKGFQVGILDERRPQEIAIEVRDRIFVHLGHDKLGPASVGEVHRLDKKAWLQFLHVHTKTDQILMTSLASETGGVCNGDSGSPVYIQGPDNQMKLAGLLQAGSLAPAHLLRSTGGKCSRLVSFMPMSRVKQIVEKLMAE